jgi:hypothetical protein
MMGALYEVVVDGDPKPLIYAYDDDDAREIVNRWYDNPSNFEIKIKEEK